MVDPHKLAKKTAAKKAAKKAPAKKAAPKKTAAAQGAEARKTALERIRERSTPKVKARNLRPGMVIDRYADGRSGFPIEKVKVQTSYGSVLIYDGHNWRGLSIDEEVRHIGSFNP